MEGLLSSASPEIQQPGTRDEPSGPTETGPAGRWQGPGIPKAMELAQEGFRVYSMLRVEGAGPWGDV